MFSSDHRSGGQHARPRGAPCPAQHPAPDMSEHVVKEKKKTKNKKQNKIGTKKIKISKKKHLEVDPGRVKHDIGGKFGNVWMVEGC
jgi:hypothetical protein